MNNSGFNSFESSGGHSKDNKWWLDLKAQKAKFAHNSSTFLYALAKIKKNTEKSTNTFYKEKNESHLQDLINFYNSTEEILNTVWHYAYDSNNRADKIINTLSSNRQTVLERLRSFYLSISNKDDRAEEQQAIFEILCELDKLFRSC